MNFPNVINPACIPTTPPPPDTRCSDPTFALLNPDICAKSPLLRIKPGILLTCALGSVQFEAFTVTDGAETALTTGVTWTVSDPTVALIGVTSGNATGIAPGTVTITATYQGLTATATLTVLPGMNCCSGNDVATMLVVDKSHSMSLQFGAGYATKQAFADSVAAAYAIQTNTQKDLIGLIEFDSAPTTDSALTSDASTVSMEAAGIINSVNKTGIGVALQAAVTALASSQANTKVIVLITDGEDQDTNPANDPVPIATAFKATGGIIICVGVRSHGAAFNTLGVMATGGFFVNAYPANAAEAIGLVYGLKGYICAGNCTPPGNDYVNEPAFNYSAFANWNAVGKINLLGPGLLDPLPGNGLYVSLGFGAQLTSKTSFNFTAGKQYQLTFFLAGNQIQDFGTQNVTVQVGDGTQFKQVIILPSFNAGLTKYRFNFTPVVNVTAPIIISSNAAVTAVVDGIYCGPILNDVNLYDISDLSQLFDDNFDMENLQYVPPACGRAVIGGGGGVGISDPPSPILTAWGVAQSANPPGFPQEGGLSSINAVTNGSGHMENGITVYYYISFVTAQGETSTSQYQTANASIIAPHNAVTITWTPITDPNIISVNIWRNGASFPTFPSQSYPTSNPFMRKIATVSAAVSTYTDLFSQATVFALPDQGGAPTANTTGSAPTGSVDTGTPIQYAVSYKTANGETKLSPTASITLATGYSSVKITTQTSPDPTVTSKRIWRFSGGAFRLLTTLSPGTADYYDLLSNASFAGSYNPAIVAPSSNTTGAGAGYLYYYGYNCYGYGCLAEPPGAQLQDPNPLPDIEASYVVPTTYTSTQSFTANCPAGTVPMNTVSNIPVLTGYNSLGYQVGTTGDTVGFEAWRAYGTGPGWRTAPVAGFFVTNEVTLPAPQAYLSAAVTADSTINGVPVNYQIRGSNDGGATFTVLFQANNVILSTNQQQNFTFTNPGAYSLYQLTMARSDGQALLMGLVEIQYFLPCPTCGGVTRSATATSLISQSNADSLALAAATLAANTALAQVGCATQYASTQTVTVKCPAGQYDGNNGNGVTASGTATSYLSQAAADASALALATVNANAILNCTNSNNQTPISIPAPQFQPAGLGIGAPYPTVKFLSGLTGTITRIRVNLLGLIHQNQSDIVMLLTGPSGQKVILIGDCGGNNPLPQTDITLDSNSAVALPAVTTMVAGSFKPTSHNPAFYGTPFPAPAPGLLPDYSPDFTGIVGQAASTANGSWALWIQDVVSLDVGGLNNGWTLQIDAA